MIKRISALLALAPLAGLPSVGGGTAAYATPNPVATNEGTYQAYGRVFPDPHGCLAYGVPDTDGDGVKDTPRGVSPWAKGRACADQFLQYQEVIEGAKFLAARFPEFVDVIRLDQAYDNPNYMSVGLPRSAAIEDGQVRVNGRDRRPLYMIKVTDKTSEIPERDRQHFAYTLSIHGIERAGVEGGTRAVEDLVTWAACELDKYKADTPACSAEGPFPKKIVESASDLPVPTAGEVLDRSVAYFVFPNPDGWARGQVSPVEVEDNSPNANYLPGFFFQRYNGNGVDVNRDWPTKGYTFRPYSPGSEPETKAFGKVLRGIKDNTSAGRFSGGIDLHGMITAHAFSYTLIGAGQRDYRKNAVTVETAIRTWNDQTKRMSWSPYVADANANGVQDEDEQCVGEGLDVPNVYGGGTRGRTPACVADEWGTVIDTIGYQITGGVGDWIDSPLGLEGIGIDNEMFASHLAPNTVFDPALEQTHIDGNKGLIYSQISALLNEGATLYTPPGKVGYVYNPVRLHVAKEERVKNPGLPAQDDIDTLIPCQSAAAENPTNCDGATFVAGSTPSLEFEVKSPKEGFFNSGISVQVTKPNVNGISDGNATHLAGQRLQLQHFDEGQWHTAAIDFNQSPLYAQAGSIVTANDPQPGRWRIMFPNAGYLGSRVQIDFNNETAEDSPGQAEIDASSMDFDDELNEYVSDERDLDKVQVSEVLNDDLGVYDTLIVTNNIGNRDALTGLGFTQSQISTYFSNLKQYAAAGGNLVLTDAALMGLEDMGIVPAGSVMDGNTMAGNFNFEIATGNVTYGDAQKYPLATDVNQPGAAEQELGRRQAVEPAPLGYTPDPGMDSTPQMPFWGVDRATWTEVCGFEDCVTATTTPRGNLVNLGEALIGSGRIRIAGIMFPDPVYEPDEANDHRFGLADYSLTYTAYEVFENLLN
jgi:hypothetical protein